MRDEKECAYAFLVGARALSATQEAEVRIFFENIGQNIGHDVDCFVAWGLRFVLAEGDSIMEGLFVNFATVVRIDVAGVGVMTF